LAERLANRLGQGRLPFDQGLVDQVREDFGIGLRAEVSSRCRQLLAQQGVVLYDSVVHHRHRARLVGMGIFL
jgi:hypothetical protein